MRRSMSALRRAEQALICALLSGTFGCGGDSVPAVTGKPDSGAGGRPAAIPSTTDAGMGGGAPDLTGIVDRGSEADAAPGCTATYSGEATFQPVRLAFAFDVSASMGKLDKP